MSNSISASAPTHNVPEKFEIRFLPRGATIQSFIVAGHNIVQNFPEAHMYTTASYAYLGETIGRVSNRIKNAKLGNLNGRTYQLYANNGPHSLHGGRIGWGNKIWSGPISVHRNGKEGVLFTYISSDGDEGYPGTVEAKVWYISLTEGDKLTLEMEYEAALVGDECEETVVSMTNHRYISQVRE